MPVSLFAAVPGFQVWFFALPCIPQNLYVSCLFFLGTCEREWSVFQLLYCTFQSERNGIWTMTGWSCFVRISCDCKWFNWCYTHLKIGYDTDYNLSLYAILSSTLIYVLFLFFDVASIIFRAYSRQFARSDSTAALASWIVTCNFNCTLWSFMMKHHKRWIKIF